MMNISIYQKQLDEAGTPVDISQSADQNERIIKCIVSGLKMLAPSRKVGQDASV